LRQVVPDEDYRMYAELGFLSVPGHGSLESGFAYLLYPHRPIVAYDTETGELLSEYCITFRDHSTPTLGSRLPDADDVLAKWISLRARERELIAEANMHLPGRQVDPSQLRRDLRRLGQWRAARARAEAAA
jgi:hypothetical protein